MKILIIRFSSIGDIVLTTPVIRCVKKQLDCEVHFLTKNSFRSLLIHNPHIDKIYSISEHINEVIDALKSEEYDLIIDLHKNLRSRAVIRKLGIKRLKFNKSNIKKWLLVNTKKNRFESSHLVERYFESLAKIGVTNDGLGLDHFISIVEEELGLMQIKEIGSYTVLVLGANYYTKQIPFEKCLEIISLTKGHIVLIGGNDVKENAHKLNEAFPEKVIDLCGKIGINVSAGVIKHAKRVITGDTGMMHIAAAYQRQIFVLWGSTVPAFGMWPYYGSQKDNSIHLQVENLSCRPCTKIGFERCPKGHFKCMLNQEVSTLELD